VALAVFYPALADAQVLIAVLGRFHVKEIHLPFGLEVLGIQRRGLLESIFLHIFTFGLLYDL
jgi:hypothetical protein